MSKIDYSQYLNKTIGRLTILDLYRSEKDNRQYFHCSCSCGALKDVRCDSLLSGRSSSCGCAMRESSQEIIKKARESLSQHPEIMQENGRKTWKENIKKAHEKVGTSRRERAICAWCQEVFGVENVQPHPDSIGGHEYDILINNTWLVEYHGIYYHCSDFHNENNPDAKGPSSFKPIDFHYNLLQNALNHGYRLIQVWEFQTDDFIHKLIKSQIDGTANPQDYIENGFLCTDYGFPIPEFSTIIPDTGTWYSSSGGKPEKVDTSYPKARYLVYNSGYSKF